ncbi:WYL domain-containing protein [Nocardioides sp. Bht2]|uniref:WYL domain-containing protein n=1 Tax=Nocardioides sp. Bht2 TaxID=3392297 RepID=UPI0039B4205B
MVAGRDQRKPMERLVRMAAALRAAGANGVAGEKLADLAEFQGAGRADQVARELRLLNSQGWQIDNIANRGEPAVYRMTTVDNRLRLRLTSAQQAALRRAALVADRADLADRLGLGAATSEPPVEVAETPHDPALGVVLQAVREGALLRFRYRGSDRVVHPESVRTQYRTWYLRGVEDGSEQVKSFVVSRMSDVDVEAPGTARPVPVEHHQTLHPMHWQIDEPVQVRLRTKREFGPDVLRWLGGPEAETVQGEELLLDYTVTHRAALYDRLYELGTRVELIGPAEIRAELLAELDSMAGPR